MPQSLVQVYVRIVFSTKDRAALLRDESVRVQMHRYLAGTCNSCGSPALEVGGVEDHFHILCRLGKTESIAGLVKKLKQSSSKWIKSEISSQRDFYW